jgi:hypothetical protein
MKRNVVIMIAIAAVAAGYFIGRMHYKMMMKNKATAASLPGQDVSTGETLTEATAEATSTDSTTTEG